MVSKSCFLFFLKFLGWLVDQLIFFWDGLHPSTSSPWCEWLVQQMHRSTTCLATATQSWWSAIFGTTAELPIVKADEICRVFFKHVFQTNICLSFNTDVLSCFLSFINGENLKTYTISVVTCQMWRPSRVGGNNKGRKCIESASPTLPGTHVGMATSRYLDLYR